MEETQNVDQKHIRIMKQHILRLQLTSTALCLQLFKNKTTSHYYSASVYYNKLVTPFSSIFSNLEEVYTQFKLTNEDNLCFDSQTHEFKYFLRTTTKICQLRITMKKIVSSRVQQLQVENFRLNKRQEQLEEIIRAHKKQSHQPTLKNTQQTLHFQKEIQVITYFQQISTHNFSQTIVKKLENCNQNSIQMPSDNQDQYQLKTVEEQIFSHSITSQQQQFLNSFTAQQQKAENTNINKPMIQEINEIQIDDRYMSQQIKKHDVKKVARSFIDHGYGLKILEEIIQDDCMSNRRYYAIMQMIMRSAFRAIQQVVRLLKEPIVSTKAQQRTLLMTPLVNCEKWLKKEELETFYNFIKAVCGLERVKVRAQSTLKLYKQIINQLLIRLALFQERKTSNLKAYRTNITKRRNCLK